MKVTVPITPIILAELELSQIANWLAFQTSDVQSAFFNEFDIQLRIACDINKGSMGASMQCHYISKGLTFDASYTLESIVRRE